MTKLASEAPVPGGGSAAMVVGAAGCSLIAMVARICARSVKYEAVHPLAQRLEARADGLLARMLALRAEDETAFEAVVAARGDKETMQRALHGAAAAPLAGARAARQALLLVDEALALGNPHLVSDLGCAAEFAYAAVTACIYNVRINHKFIVDRGAIEPQCAELEELERQATTILARVRTATNAGLRKLP